MDGDEPPGHEERRLALEVDGQERVLDLRRVEGDGLRLGAGRRGEQAARPGLVARTPRLRHHPPPVFLVARARAGGVVVARRDEAEAETARFSGIVEVGQRQDLLCRAARAEAERRIEAIAALAAILPFIDRRIRDGLSAGDAGVEVVAARRLHALLALVGGGVPAAGADDLAGLPAAGQIVGGRCRTARLPRVVEQHLAPAPVLLGVAVARVDLDQRLLLRIVLRRGELLVPTAAGRRVEAPGGAVRDDQGVEAPLRELFEQRLRRLRRLVTVGGQ